MTRALAIGTLALVGAGVAGCASEGSSAPTRPSPVGRLVAASEDATSWSYSLPRVANCVVGDGLAVLKDEAGVPMRITGLETDLAGVPSGSTVHVTYQLVAVRRGSTTGELSGNGPLTRLAPARALRRADGATLRPASTSGLWYVVVARLHVDGHVLHRWFVRGLTVRYVTGTRLRDAFFPQHVTLQMDRSCTAATPRIAAS